MMTGRKSFFKKSLRNLEAGKPPHATCHQGAPFQKKKCPKKAGGNMHAAAPESATGYEGTEFRLLEIPVKKIPETRWVGRKF